MQKETVYNVFQKEPCAIEVFNEKEEKNQYPLPDHRDVKMEIKYVVKSNDSRTRVIYPILVLNEIESYRIEKDCSMMSIL